ncbi:hypothetical protein C8A01DRAFT_35582 [Parachaetomium inaequale]|uniref:Uncharacterized protein n=1 Tax=Parachaetomium inaequale TaxID=2588326 RepID=A0AAN6PI36_9PEZI|nr:hypothetical protein C8A01DRAFT_35582 [Parachaetomium inaequale]
MSRSGNDGGGGGGRGGSGRRGPPPRFYKGAPGTKLLQDVRDLEDDAEATAKAQSQPKVGQSAGPPNANPAPPKTTGADKGEGKITVETIDPPPETSETNLPRRPAYGTGGRAAYLWANYVELSLKRDWAFYRYAIDITRIKDTQAGKGKKDEKMHEKPPANGSSGNGTDELAAQLARTSTLSSNSDSTSNGQNGHEEAGDKEAQPAGMKRAAIIAHLFGHHDELKAGCDNGTLASDYRNIVVSTQPLEDLVYTVEFCGVRSD